MHQIIVISDTHMPKRGKQLPGILINYLETCHSIIHAGDFQTMDVYKELRCYAHVYGVCGNVDDESIQSELPSKMMIEIEGVKIGIIHGHGVGKTTEKRVLDAFINDDVQLIVFGHSHIPVIKQIDGKWLFNPGSPTDKRRQEKYSFGIITIHVGEFKLEHIFFDKDDI